MPEITPSSSLSFTVTGGASGGIPAPTSLLKYDFTAPDKYENSSLTSAATYAAIDNGTIGWTNVSFECLKNMSSTTGENITIARPPIAGTNMVDDGTVAGASVPATLTAFGHFKVITTAGTSQGIDWNPGDIALYSGSSGSYVQIKPAEFAILKPGMQMTVPVKADGRSWYFKAATGTPEMARVAIGQCTY